MTKNCPFDHPSVYYAATVLYAVGLTSLLVASTSRTLGPIAVLTVVGLAAVAVGGFLDKRRVESRVRRAVEEDRKLQPVLRLHMVMKEDLRSHCPSSKCICRPTEVSPGLWIHHQPGKPNCLADLEENKYHWTTLRENYTPKEP